jgi:hypothetical protein
MKKFIVLALASLLLAAFSANTTEASQRKHTRSASSVNKIRVTQPPDKPVTRLPIPADTFRA